MKKIFILSICVMVATTGKSQLSDKVEVGLPRVLASRILSEKDVNSVNASNKWGQGNKTNRFWVAWSDRADNTTFKGPSESSGVKGHLNFNETVRIAQIENNFAHVYVEKQTHRPYPQIVDAVDKGWIQMSKLLLWESCPTNDRGIFNKALIVVNLGSKVQNVDNLFKVYTNPNRKTDRGYATSSINFRFVMKEDKETGMVLLSNESSLNGTSDKMLYGWFNKDSYVKWNQRSCLEPNWDRDDVDYFKANNEKLEVYTNGNLTGEPITKPFSYGSITNEDYQQDVDKYRMPKGSLRYPILDKNEQTNDNNYYCNVFAQNGSLTGAAQHNDSILRLQNSAVSNMESVNLIVAIDGTRSMEPFYNPVKDAIKRGYSLFEGQSYNVKVGIVIYRDYKDGQYLTEVLPLTKHNDPRIGEFLDKGGDGKYGIKSAPGDDVPEALFEGLMAATDKQKMKFKEKESNLLLVVGDCGNRKNDKRSPIQSDIIKRLIDNKFQVVAFQVRWMNQPAYNWFQEQMCDIISGNIRGQIDEMVRKKGNLGFKVSWRPSTQGLSGLTLNSGLANRYYIGSLLYPDLGKDMEVAHLSKFIQDNLEKYSKAINSQRDLYANWMGNATDSVEASFNEAFMADRLGSKYVNFIKRTNSIMSAPGYAAQKDKNGHDYWKTVVYISAAELDDLIKRLEGVNKASRNSDYTNRKPYVDAFKGIVKAMIPDISDERMNAMSQDEIMAQVVGLNAQTQTTKSYTLQDIIDPKIVDDQTYAGIVNSFSRKYKSLVSIKTSSYPYRLIVNKNTYYWIPTEMIP